MAIVGVFPVVIRSTPAREVPPAQFNVRLLKANVVRADASKSPLISLLSRLVAAVSPTNHWVARLRLLLPANTSPLSCVPPAP